MSSQRASHGTKAEPLGSPRGPGRLSRFGPRASGPCNGRRASRLGCQGIHPRGRPIGPLRRFWALGEERIILATALMHDLRKHVNAQRLGLSTCKAGALPTELRPRVSMSINVLHQTRKNTYVTPILSPETAQRLQSVCFLSLRPCGGRIVSALIQSHTCEAEDGAKCSVVVIEAEEVAVAVSGSQ